jgi:hypothetical protein
MLTTIAMMDCLSAEHSSIMIPSDESTKTNMGVSLSNRKRIRSLLYVVNFSFKSTLETSISHCILSCDVREERLVKKAKKESVDEGINKVLESIQRQAAVVEEILYRNHLKQPNVNGDDPFNACNDMNDNDRINEILSRQLTVIQGHFSQRCKKRREAQRLKPEIPDQDLRERTLKLCLGVDQYRRANAILKAIDQLGVELTGDCSTGTECVNRMRLTKGSMPEPVRQLFCQTTLRADMYFTPLSQLHLINWDESLKKAECRLNKYKEWCKNLNTGRVNVPENIENEVPEIVNFGEKCVIRSCSM